jgi:hypothetical protein
MDLKDNSPNGTISDKMTGRGVSFSKMETPVPRKVLSKSLLGKQTKVFHQMTDKLRIPD